MSTTNTNGNGRVQRKTLADQLNRLDNTIDALADGVNRAVADAVREGITQAVQEAMQLIVREVMANPELLRQLVAQLAPLPPIAAVADLDPKPQIEAKTGFGSRLACCWLWLRSKASNAAAWCWQKICLLPEGFRKVGRKIKTIGDLVWVWRTPLAISLLIGLVMGAMGYLSGPFLSSLALGACSSTMGFVAYLMAPFVKLWKSLKTQAA